MSSTIGSTSKSTSSKIQIKFVLRSNINIKLHYEAYLQQSLTIKCRN